MPSTLRLSSLLVAVVFLTLSVGAWAGERIGIYTGSFDPPHVGHRSVVKSMKERFQLDRVYVVADRLVDYKPEMQSLQDREAMVRLLFEDDSSVNLLTPKMERHLGRGELWDVYRVVKEANPDAELFGLMGTDTFAWYSSVPASNRVHGVTLLVARRASDVDHFVPATLDGDPVKEVGLENSSVSSTKIRKAIREGRAPADLPRAVYRYIVEHGLFFREGCSDLLQ